MEKSRKVLSAARHYMSGLTYEDERVREDYDYQIQESISDSIDVLLFDEDLYDLIKSEYDDIEECREGSSSYITIPHLGTYISIGINE